MKSVLIIEDDKFLAALYRDKFQSEGFEVEVAEDGKTGIDKIAKSPPDAVLLDLMLPGVSGVDVLKFVRSHQESRKLPVIVLSNAYAGNLMQAAEKAGANKCLSKGTCRPNQLVAEVRNVMASGDPAPRTDPPASARHSGPAAAAPSTDLADFPLAASRRDLQSSLPILLKNVRQRLQNLLESDEAGRAPPLLDLFRAVHAMASRAVFAEFAPIGRLGSALEALVSELHAKPKKVTSSSLNTVSQAVELLALLIAHAADASDEMILSSLILVVDDEPLSRSTICTALDKARLRAVSLEDPAVALKLVEENRFDLVFLDVDMPGLNGFEVCKRLHATPANATTPVVFVTALSDFETRSRSESSGGTDFIAKPINLIELAVKALIHLMHGQLHRANAAQQPRSVAHT